MGLDLSIGARLKDKKTKEETYIDIAYWRKAYGIRDMLVEVANKYKVEHPENYEDLEIVCHKKALREIISNLSRELGNFDSNYWTNSIFEPAEVRQSTIGNLRRLIAFQDWLDREIDSETITAYSFVDLNEDNFIFKDRDNYKVRIEIINSY